MESEITECPDCLSNGAGVFGFIEVDFPKPFGGESALTPIRPVGRRRVDYFDEDHGACVAAVPSLSGDDVAHRVDFPADRQALEVFGDSLWKGIIDANDVGSGVKHGWWGFRF